MIDLHWAQIETQGVLDGWHLEGTGARARFMAVQGSGTDKIIRSLVKIAQVSRSGHSAVIIMADTDEFLKHPKGTMSKLVAEATTEAYLRPRA